MEKTIADVNAMAENYRDTRDQAVIADKAQNQAYRRCVEATASALLAATGQGEDVDLHTRNQAGFQAQGLISAAVNYLDFLAGKTTFDRANPPRALRGHHFGSLAWFVCFSCDGYGPWLYSSCSFSEVLEAAQILQGDRAGELLETYQAAKAAARELRAESGELLTSWLDALAPHITNLVVERKGGRWAHFLILSDGSRIAGRVAGRQYTEATLHAQAVISQNEKEPINDRIKYSQKLAGSICYSARPVKTFKIQA